MNVHDLPEPVAPVACEALMDEVLALRTEVARAAASLIARFGSDIA